MWGADGTRGQEGKPGLMLGLRGQGGGVGGIGLILRGRAGIYCVSISAGNYSKRSRFMGSLVVDTGGRGWGPPPKDKHYSCSRFFLFHSHFTQVDFTYSFQDIICLMK